MLHKLIKQLNSKLRISVSYEDLTDFNIGIYKINLARSKITALAFIVIEIFMLIVMVITKRGDFFKAPFIYYGVMYCILLIVMLIFLINFKVLEKDIPNNLTRLRLFEIAFINVILLWSAGISLLDQLTNGQIIVYIVVAVAVASAIIVEPIILLMIYTFIEALFLILMPYFQNSNSVLFVNYINSITLLIISWVISYMRFKKQIEDFNTKKMLQNNNEELKKINKELAEANQMLEKLSKTDSLTGINNRHMFDNALKAEWERCRRHFIPLSLIMIDIDLFKSYNDHYGHLAGDECIKKIAGVLSSCARRSSDTVARYGGEEFVLILPYFEKEDVLNLAEQIRKKVEDLKIPHNNSDISDYVTVSLGVITVIPSVGSSVNDLIISVDKALYNAKKSRNNTVVA